jgi:hypothetical protein
MSCGGTLTRCCSRRSRPRSPAGSRCHRFPAGTAWAPSNRSGLATQIHTETQNQVQTAKPGARTTAVQQKMTHSRSQWGSCSAWPTTSRRCSSSLRCTAISTRTNMNAGTFREESKQSHSDRSRALVGGLARAAVPPGNAHAVAAAIGVAQRRSVPAWKESHRGQLAANQVL